jgi:methyl-accepting chemotaxis protein
MARLAETLPAGQTPAAADWQALLSAGYTTDEQRAVATGQPAPRSAQAATETTFF